MFCAFLCLKHSARVLVPPSIFQKSREGTVRRLNPLHLKQLILHCAAILGFADQGPLRNFTRMKFTYIYIYKYIHTYITFHSIPFHSITFHTIPYYHTIPYHTYITVHYITSHHHITSHHITSHHMT